MAVLAAQQIARAGLEPVFAAAAEAGDSFANTGNEYVEIVNASAGPITVTFVTPNTVDTLAVADRTVAVPAGESRKCGPFPTGTYNDANGRVAMTYSAFADLTVGVFTL